MMKIGQLKQLLQGYDHRKGWRRRLFGDALPIRLLKELINQKEASAEYSQQENTDISLDEYRNYALSNGHIINPKDHLFSTTASGELLKEWVVNDSVTASIESTTRQAREQMVERIRQVVIQPFQLNLNNLILDNFYIAPISQSTAITDFLRIREETDRIVNFSQFRQHTFFRFSPHTEFTQSTHRNARNPDDNYPYGYFGHAAPAA
jgi:hypothetical protein